MILQNRDMKHLATPRIVRLFRALRGTRPMATIKPATQEKTAHE